MLNLLKYQFRKLPKFISLYVGIAVGIAIYLIEGLAVVSMGETFADYLPNFDPNCMIIIFIGVFVALFTCSDNSNGAMKIIIGKGYTRTQTFFSKLIVCLTANLIYCFVAIVTPLIIGATMKRGVMTDQIIRESAYAYFLRVVCLCGMTCVYFGLSEMCGKSLIAVPVCLLVCVFFLEGAGLFDLIFLKCSFNASDYILTSVYTALTQIPIMNSLATRAWVCPIVYSAVFLGLGYLFALRREVK